MLCKNKTLTWYSVRKKPTWNWPDRPVATPELFTALGLSAAGYRGWRGFSEQKQIAKFKECYGCEPLTTSQLYNDIIVQQSPFDPISPYEAKRGPVMFLVSLRFLWTYDTEADIGRFFKIQCTQTISAYVTRWVPKIAMLLESKVRYPTLSVCCASQEC